MKALGSTHPILRRYQPGNRVRLLRDGAETYPAMLEAIRAARERVCLETYILRADALGERFLEALAERAKAGIAVYLMFDGLGSFGLPEPFLWRIREAGIQAVAYHPLHHLLSWRRLNRRNHRKSLIVDGKIGFVGGINIANEYAPTEQGGGGWRDTNLRIDGPAVFHLETLFFRTWFRAGGKGSAVPLAGGPLPLAGGSLVRILGSRTIRERRIIRSAYLRAIALAEARVRVTNAYFLPDPVMIRALRKAARRGVEVSVILGGTGSDVPWVAFAARCVYGKLLRGRIRLYEWQGPNLHAKTAVVDGLWSTVGSYNLDYRSLLHNLEVNAAVIDGELGREMERMFEEDLRECRPVTYEAWKARSWLERARDWLAYRFRFLL